LKLKRRPPLTTQALRRIFTTKSTSALSRESVSPFSRRSRAIVAPRWYFREP
jgi:hypothetical protein